MGSKFRRAARAVGIYLADNFRVRYLYRTRPARILRGGGL